MQMNAQHPCPIRPTGMAVIDADHRGLWEMLTRLRGEGGQKALVGVSDALLGLAHAHFVREEALHRRFSFSDGPRHRKQHQWFLERVRNFRDAQRDGQPHVTSALDRLLQETSQEMGHPPAPQGRPEVRLAGLLVDWLLKHTNGLDQVFIAFLRDQGIDPASVAVGDGG